MDASGVVVESRFESATRAFEKQRPHRTELSETFDARAASNEETEQDRS
jgi:hypothetical protein